MKHSITPEEHARVQRRRGRQALGLLVAILVVVGFVTVLRAGVGAVANLFDDTAQKQEYEDKLEGLVLFVVLWIFSALVRAGRARATDSIASPAECWPFSRRLRSSQVVRAPPAS